MDNEEVVRRGGGNFSASEYERLAEIEAERYREKELDEDLPIICHYCQQETIQPNDKPYYDLKACQFCHNELEELNDQEECLKAYRAINRRLPMISLSVAFLIFCCIGIGVLLTLLIQSIIR